MLGTYVLLIELATAATIQVGRLGMLAFAKGYYAYVGSALGGLEQRIDRHLRTEKKLFWHIDYLLNLLEEKVNKLREMSPLYDLAKEGVDIDKLSWAKHSH